MKTIFEIKRAGLFFSSYAAVVIAREIRESQGLSQPITYTKWQTSLRKKYPKELATFEAARALRIAHVVSYFVPDTSILELEDFAMPEAMRISSETKIPAEELRYFFITGKRRPKDKVAVTSNTDGAGVFWSLGAPSVFPAGTYLQVHSEMKSRELLQRFRAAVITAKGLAGDELSLTRNAKSSKQREQNYLLIEKWLKTTENDRVSSYDNAHFAAALDGALDELMESKYPNQQSDDSLIEKLRLKIKNDYYAVASTYNLPTLTDIPTLFRVMLH